MIDSDGFRLNVGIILANRQREVFWARRRGMDAWQFPQGGVKGNESPDVAMYRELAEETGLLPQHVELIGSTRRWLRYRIPRRFIRYDRHPVCIGQKQIWYVLRFVGDESDVQLNHSQHPEFDSWRWVDYWQPVREVVSFKRGVYRKALTELAPVLFNDCAPPSPPGWSDGVGEDALAGLTGVTDR
ncbi:MAG TPA: RNA pyrophosphohydrolase [Gammaproteobacteria bacterium]|nr:RNA pyrophosphohydrolase [Gammaproteobacteria bacterium]